MSGSVLNWKSLSGRMKGTIPQVKAKYREGWTTGTKQSPDNWQDISKHYVICFCCVLKRCHDMRKGEIALNDGSESNSNRQTWLCTTKVKMPSLSFFFCTPIALRSWYPNGKGRGNNLLPTRMRQREDVSWWQRTKNTRHNAGLPCGRNISPSYPGGAEPTKPLNSLQKHQRDKTFCENDVVFLKLQKAAE